MARFFSNLCRIFMWTVFAAAVVIVLRFVTVERLNEEIRAYLEGTLSQHYAAHGLVVTIESARRLGDHGIEIRGVSIRDREASKDTPSLVYVDEITALGRTTLAELLQGQPEIHRLVVKRMKMRLWRGRDGNWSLSRLFPPPRLSDRCPKIRLEDTSLELLSPMRGVDPLRLREGNFELIPHPVNAADPEATRWEIIGTVASDYCDQLRLAANVEMPAGKWQLQSGIQQLRVSPPLYRIAQAWFPLPEGPLAALQGAVELELQAAGQLGNPAPVEFTVSGQLLSGRLDPQTFPLPLSDLQALFQCDNHSVRIDRITGRSGLASLQANFSSGWDEESPLRAQLTARKLTLDWRLVEALPGRLREVWRKLQPAGVIDVDVAVNGTRCEPELDVTIDCHDVAATYYEFPYRIDGGRGRIHYHQGQIRIENFQALASGQKLFLRGELKEVGKETVGWVELNTEGPVPLDKKLLDALNEETADIVRQLQPSGSLVLNRARIERSRVDEPMRKYLDIDVVNGAIRYERFPYPLTVSQGKLLLTERGWEFRDFRGHNDSAYVTCVGGWTPHERHPGGKLLLEFHAWDVPLEDELYDALPKESQKLWSELRPRGSIDHLVVRMRHDPQQLEPFSLELLAEEWSPERNVEGRSIALEPRWFAYRLEQLTGVVHYAGGQVQLDNLRAVHGETTAQASGEARIHPDGRWVVELTHAFVDRLQLDRELIAALPSGFTQGISEIQLRGPINLRRPEDSTGPVVRVEGGSFKAPSRDGSGSESTPTVAFWDVAADIYDGSLVCGAPLEHIQGTVRLTGNLRGAAFMCRGLLQLDSLFCRGIQLTKVQGPFYVDHQQASFGQFALTERDPRQADSITADVFGGRLHFDGWTQLEEAGRFELVASMHSGDLRQLAHEMVSRQQNLRGRAYAQLRLHGQRNRLSTLRGDGRVQLRDADIYQLPVMVALLKTLSFQPPDTTAFTTSNARMRVEGDRIYFDYIDFQGDAITLKGQGEMDFTGQIELQFYTLVGRDNLMLLPIRPLVGEASRQILEIQVAGSLNEPTIRQTAFPRLNETLQQLFPELAKPAATTANRPSLIQDNLRSLLPLPRR